MLNVANKPFVLSVIILNVVMLSVVAPTLFMQSYSPCVLTDRKTDGLTDRQTSRKAARLAGSQACNLQNGPIS